MKKNLLLIFSICVAGIANGLNQQVNYFTVITENDMKTGKIMIK